MISPISRLQCTRHVVCRIHQLQRCRGYATTKSTVEVDESSGNAILNPRWLSETKARIGKCITFGMPSPLVDEAGKILEELGQDWRELVAGSEGFLTDKRRAGLHRQSIVWGDHDNMGHVNNVRYVRFAESGRCNWTRKIGHFDTAHKKEWEELLSNRGIGLILKSITVDFKFPMTWPDRVSVYHKLRSKPDKNTNSMIMDVMILSETRQRPSARCLEEGVVFDYTKQTKTSLPPFMFEQFKHIYDLQEAAKQRNQKKIQDIDNRVRRIERETWDRPDAKEDLGSAT